VCMLELKLMHASTVTSRGHGCRQQLRQVLVLSGFLLLLRRPGSTKLRLNSSLKPWKSTLMARPSALERVTSLTLFDLPGSDDVCPILTCRACLACLRIPSGKRAEKKVTTARSREPASSTRSVDRPSPPRLPPPIRTATDEGDSLAPSIILHFQSKSQAATLHRSLDPERYLSLRCGFDPLLPRGRRAALFETEQVHPQLQRLLRDSLLVYGQTPSASRYSPSDIRSRDPVSFQVVGRQTFPLELLSATDPVTNLQGDTQEGRCEAGGEEEDEGLGVRDNPRRWDSYPRKAGR
jgi:hypothetical protein